METAQQQRLIDRLAAAPGPAGSQRLNWRLFKERAAGRSMAVITALVSALALIMGIALLIRSWPLLAAKPLPALLFSTAWHPTQGRFGFWPFIMGSAAVTVLALALAVPVSLLVAIYMSEYTWRVRALVKPVVDVMASIPSVVYGVWGILFVVPAIRTTIGPLVGSTIGQAIPLFAHTNSTGFGMIAGAIVLAIMVFPIIVSVTEEVLRSVPHGIREASLSLGATKWETTKYVVLRKALPGVVAAVVLGFSRAFGETLAVLMVVGNVVQIPHSIFDAAYPLPALIANNYGELMSIPMYDAALMFAALLLMAVVLLFNVAAQLTLARFAREK